jgi:two-component system chemotaxis response regulator CheB
MSGARPVRVLLADDSRTVRARLASALAGDRRFELVAEAEDGARAVDLCLRLRPDVIALDLVMPGASGLEATELIMARCPTPILVVSSAGNRGEAFRTLDALAAGAVDSIEKPGPDDDDDAWDDAFRRALAVVAGVRVLTHPRASLRPNRALDTAPLLGTRATAVTLAASTGGPAAVATILGALPESFRAPILLVIHVGTTFGASLASWLDRQSRLRVTLASDGEPIAASPARVLLAPPDRHMLVEAGRVRLSDAAERHSCRPSADVLFESAARELGPRAVGCLLTGMGADGAAGLLAMRRAGALTLAQDEATSAVFGMPRAAIELGAAAHVLPISEIAAALRAHVDAVPSPRNVS